MAKNSPIEWTDHTFNMWFGCTKVSPACVHCYAEKSTPVRIARARGRELWGKGQPRQRTREANWKEPLKWNNYAICDECGEQWFKGNVGALCGGGALFGCTGVLRRPRVFCASLADWLDDEVPIEWLADLLKLIHDTPTLDWLLLTKRPENFFERVDDAYDHSHGEGWQSLWTQGDAPENVWIGTTVENQEYADKRIPELLKIPAKVRFLSCEPLLGPVNLDRWIKPYCCCGFCRQSYDISEAIPDPEGHPLGADKCAKCGKENFMSSCDGDEALEHWHDRGFHIKEPVGIDWVICGGESDPERGDKARPSHPDWFRSLRDQCHTAAIPFFFKQWGDWGSITAGGLTPEVVEGSAVHEFDYPFCAFRVGKKAAGRLLDGQEHSAFPAA